MHCTCSLPPSCGRASHPARFVEWGVLVFWYDRVAALHDMCCSCVYHMHTSPVCLQQWFLTLSNVSFIKETALHLHYIPSAVVHEHVNQPINSPLVHSKPLLFSLQYLVPKFIPNPSLQFYTLLTLYKFNNLKNHMSLIIQTTSPSLLPAPARPLSKFPPKTIFAPKNILPCFCTQNHHTPATTPKPSTKKQSIQIENPPQYINSSSWLHPAPLLHVHTSRAPIKQIQNSHQYRQ